MLPIVIELIKMNIKVPFSETINSDIKSAIVPREVSIIKDKQININNMIIFLRSKKKLK
jgi:hypothetical protein